MKKDRAAVDQVRDGGRAARLHDVEDVENGEKGMSGNDRGDDDDDVNGSRRERRDESIMMRKDKEQRQSTMVMKLAARVDSATNIASHPKAVR